MKDCVAGCLNVSEGGEREPYGNRSAIFQTVGNEGSYACCI